jgi:hypothetical protein
MAEKKKPVDDKTPPTSVIWNVVNTLLGKIRTHNHDASYMAAGATYTTISGNDAATDVTGAELEDLTDGGNTTLHKHSFLFPFATYIASNPLSATGASHGGTVDRDIGFTEWTQSVYIVSAQSSVNYWTFELFHRPTGGGGDVTLASFDTKTATSANLAYTFSTTTFNPTSISSGGFLFVRATLTAAGGNIYILCPALECAG